MKNYVYITTNPGRDKFFIDYTTNLEGRLQQHYCGIKVPMNKWDCSDLVYLETFERAGPAIGRSFQLQYWKQDRIKKLIRKKNPELMDLTAEWRRWRSRSVLKGMILKEKSPEP